MSQTTIYSIRYLTPRSTILYGHKVKETRIVADSVRAESGLLMFRMDVSAEQDGRDMSVTGAFPIDRIVSMVAVGTVTAHPLKIVKSTTDDLSAVEQEIDGVMTRNGFAKDSKGRYIRNKIVD